jgi:hypothetical protein
MPRAGSLTIDSPRGREQHSYEHHVNNVGSVATYVNEAGGAEVNETVRWSRVRYTGHNLMVVDVTPTSMGTTRMEVRTLNGSGVEVDRCTLARTP